MEVSGQLRAPAAVAVGKGVSGRYCKSGCCGVEYDLLTLPGIE
jgi:hypothetical protein